MPKLQLPDVTLVCVETREHELAAMAVEDCLRVAEFGDVLILTDKPEKWPGIWLARPVDGAPKTTEGPRWKKVPDWPDKVGWSRSWWYDVPPLLRTRQTLNIQWDSWIWDASLWRNEWMEYDYIGAPWWYPHKNVGNGGFSLVSTRLKRFMLKNRAKFPCDTDIDDDLLCRKYRPQLEDHGFVWAPDEVAYEFSWEGCGQKETTKRKHFGFHAMFNWGLVLDKEALLDRARAAARSPNLTNPDNPRFRLFCEQNPDVARQVLLELEPTLTRQEN